MNCEIVNGKIAPNVQLLQPIDSTPAKCDPLECLSCTTESCEHHCTTID